MATKLRLHCLQVLLILFGSVTCANLNAAETTVYANAATDYVYRGVSRSDSHGALQLGADVSFDSGFYAGIWGSTVDIGDNANTQRDVEVNYYVGYGLQLSDRWAVGVVAVAFAFPGSVGITTYDHEEYSLALNYDDRLWFEYSLSPDYYGRGVQTHNYDLFTEMPLHNRLSLSAGIGWYDVAEFSGSGYSYWQVGLSRPFGDFDVDLRYHDTNRWVRGISDPGRTRARLVLSARIQF